MVKFTRSAATFATGVVMRMNLTSTGTVNTTAWKVVTVLKGPYSTTVKYVHYKGLYTADSKNFSAEAISSVRKASR